MFKNLIRKLYKRFCYEEQPFFVPQKKFTEEELRIIYTECKTMIDMGVLEQVIDMVVAKSEEKQLCESNNFIVKVTEAELERERRGGIEDLFDKIKDYANKARVETKEFDKFESI